MFPIHKNSYLQSRADTVDPRTLNRCIDRARDLFPITDPFDITPPFYRLTSAQPNIPIDNVDVTRRPVAFGRWAMPKLRRELHDPDPTVVIAAITSICDLVHDPERAYEAIQLKIPDRMADLLLDPLAPVRERTLLALSTMAGLDAGKEAIVTNPVLLHHLKLTLGDVLLTVRMKAADCVQKIAETWMTADVLVSNDFIEELMGHVQREVDDVVVVHLESLKGLMYDCGKYTALRMYDTFRILMSLLEHPNSDIVCKALDCLALLTSTPKGKSVAIEKNLLKTLNKLLHYGDTDVCTSAAGVLMFCTVQTRAKHLAAAFTSLPKRLVNLAQSLANPTLQMFAIKALTNMCEHPVVRKQVKLHYLDKLENLQVSEESVYFKKVLLNVVVWCPETAQ